MDTTFHHILSPFFSPPLLDILDQPFFCLFILCGRVFLTSLAFACLYAWVFVRVCVRAMLLLSTRWFYRLHQYIINL